MDELIQLLSDHECLVGEPQQVQINSDGSCMIANKNTRGGVGFRNFDAMVKFLRWVVNGEDE